MHTELKSQSPAKKARQAFTLIELLVSMAVLSLLMVMVFQMVDQTQQTWNVARTRVSQFREARVAFDAVTRNLTQATLNTYFDYDYGAGSSDQVDSYTKVPIGYQRQSDLHFICGSSSDILSEVEGIDRRPGHAIFFQTPGGFGTNEEDEALNDLLNARGYFVEYGEDSAFKPAFLLEHTKPRYRFRLMELRPPADSLLVYLSNLRDDPKKELQRQWFTKSISSEFEGGSNVRPIADNIIAAFFLPKFSEANTGDLALLTDDYSYDSREWQNGTSSPRAVYSKNLMPPLLEITMVAVDEKSMIRFQQLNGGSEAEMPAFVPDELFRNYSSYDSYTDDLERMKSALDTKKISYRVFNQTVSLRSAGWSRSST